MLKWILGIILLSCAIAVVVSILRRSGGLTGDPVPGEPQPAAPEAPSFQELFAQSRRLEQDIAGIVGGDTGLARLLGAIETCRIERDEDNIFKITYREKQKKLAKYMEEYRELEKKAARLPADKRARVLFAPEDYETYQILLNQEV